MSGDCERLRETLLRALADPDAVSQDDLHQALAGADRRGSARLGVQFEALVHLAGRPEDDLRTALVTDVGPGGASVRLRGSPPVPGQVVLRVGPALGPPCELPGRLAWLRPERWSTRAGIQFAEGSSHAWFAALREVVRRAAGGERP
jgi:hypothetical protein